MTEKPLVSILITMHNMKPWLQQCLDSIRAQTVQDFEVVLVDDGSDDGSGELADMLASEYPVIRVIHQDNRGVSAARNAALANARGSLIFPVDADDWLQPDCLSALLALKEKTGAAVAACNHFIDECGSSRLCFPSQKGDLQLTAREALEGVLYHRIPDVSCWAKLWDKKLFDGLSYPEGKLYEDTWLIAPLLLRAGRMAWTSKPGYHYRIRPDSISRSVWGTEKLDFIDAVNHLTQTVQQAYPELQTGCIRRQCHARLSLLRYFVQCPKVLRPVKKEMRSEALALAPQVLRDPKAPRRDKLALMALRIHPACFDLLWRLNERRK